MPATQKPMSPPRPSEAARATARDDAQKLERVTRSLKVAQKDLASVGDSVGTGVRDLRRDATKLLRDARRDLTKMSRAIQRDLDRFQKDLTAAASGKPKGTRGTRSTPTAHRQSAH
jgi:hypothetical protein